MAGRADFDAAVVEPDGIAELLESLAASGTPVLDLRPEASFCAIRLNHASANIPFDALKSKAYQLPTRDEPFCLLVTSAGGGAAGTGDPEGAERAAGGGGREGGGCSSGSGSGNVWGEGWREWGFKQWLWFRECRAPWQIGSVLLDSPELWEAVRAAGHALEGPPPEEEMPLRLWKPSPLVEEWLPELQARAARCGVPLTCTDLGCGSGRDVVFCAMSGWSVLGVDNMKGALERTQRMAGDFGVAVRVQGRVLDLEKLSLEELAREVPPASLVLVIRYLHRPLLLVLRDLVAPGGFVVYCHFLLGAEKVLGHPSHPRDMLEPGELARVFAGWEVLLDEEGALPDTRPVNNFIARRPLNG